jgi:hypothetical protein
MMDRGGVDHRDFRTILHGCRADGRETSLLFYMKSWMSCFRMPQGRKHIMASVSLFRVDMRSGDTHFLKGQTRLQRLCTTMSFPLFIL